MAPAIRDVFDSQRRALRYALLSALAFQEIGSKKLGSRYEFL
jgi:hypothetical protein